MGLIDKLKGSFVKTEEEVLEEKKHRETLKRIELEHKRKEKIEYENAKHEARLEQMRKQGRTEGSKPGIKETIKQSLNVRKAITTNIERRKEEEAAKRRGYLKNLEYEAEHKNRLQRKHYNNPPKTTERKINIPRGINDDYILPPQIDISKHFFDPPKKRKKQNNPYNPFQL